MGKLPALKSKVVLRALHAGGFDIMHQTGSHVRLHHPEKPHVRVTVPFHTRFDLPPSVIQSILRQAELSRDEFLELL